MFLTPSIASSWFRVLRNKSDFLRRGGLAEGKANQIGLFPTPGWGQRNVTFFREIILPTLVTKRGGQFLYPQLDSPRRGQLAVTWIGHASFLVQSSQLNILVDPIWAMWLKGIKRVRKPGIAFSALPAIDLVLITHAHYDHMDLPSLGAIAQGQPIIVPRGVGSLVRRYKLNFHPIVERDWWEEYQLDGVKITATPARHWGARFVHDGQRGFGGYVVETPCGSFYHCGDSAYFDGFKEIGQRHAIDLALMPIGAYQAPSGRNVHMTPEEAVQAFIDLGAQAMSPMHYGTYPLGGEPLHEPLERLVVGAGAKGLSHRVRILEEGVPQILGGQGLSS